MSDDLIRRSDVLRVIEETEMSDPYLKGELRRRVRELPVVRPGATLEPMVVENPDWQLYTEYRGDKPYAYRYGPEWVAMQLYMEGGYKTPEEAKLAWLREWEAQK